MRKNYMRPTLRKLHHYNTLRHPLEEINKIDNVSEKEWSNMMNMMKAVRCENRANVWKATCKVPSSWEEPLQSLNSTSPHCLESFGTWLHRIGHPPRNGEPESQNFFCTDENLSPKCHPKNTWKIKCVPDKIAFLLWLYSRGQHAYHGHILRLKCCHN